MKTVNTPMGHTIYKLEEYEIKAAVLDYLVKTEDLRLNWYQVELMLNSFAETYSIYYRKDDDE